MSDIFNTVWDAPLNSTITSNTIVANFGDGTPITIITDSGVLVKNNIRQGSSTTIDDGDTLRIEVISDSTNLSASYVVITIGTILHVFSCVTIEDNTQTLYPPFKEMLPLDLMAYQDGSPWVPSTIGNHLTQYTPTGVVSSTINIMDTGQAVPTTTDFVVVANYFKNTITKVAPNGTILKHIAIGNKPYGFAYTPTSVSDKTALLWVTLSGEDKVVCLDVNDRVVATYPTGGRPMGIAACADGRHVYVANYQSGTVTHLTYDGTMWNSTSVTVGQFPFAVVVENNGNAWITCTKGNLLYKVTKNNIVTSYPVGNGLRGLAIDTAGTALWIAASLDSKVCVFNLLSNSVTGSIAVDELPYDVNVGSTGVAYVYGLAKRKVQKIVGGAVDSSFVPDLVDFGASFASNGNLWVANYYANAPSYVMRPDWVPDPIQFNTIIGLAPNEVAQSNTVTITGFDGDVKLSVAPIYGAIIMMNGTPAPSPVLVSNGDTFYVRFTAPAQNEVTFSIPIIVGGTAAYISGSTRTDLNIPNTVYFDTPTEVEIRSMQQSSEVTVAGLADDISVPISISHSEWRFVFNGTMMPSDHTINMKNGDKFAIVGPAYGSYNSTLEFSVLATVDELKFPFGIFHLKTKLLDGPTHSVQQNYAHDMLYIKRIYPSVNNSPKATFLRDYRPITAPISIIASKPPRRTEHTIAPLVGERNVAETKSFVTLPIFTRLPAPTRRLGPIHGYAHSATLKLVVAPERSFINSAALKLTLAPERNFIRNDVPQLVIAGELVFIKDIPLTIVEVDPKYDRDTRFTQRTYAPNFSKEMAFPRRLVAPIYQRNTTHKLVTDQQQLIDKYKVGAYVTRTFIQLALKAGNVAAYPILKSEYIKDVGVARSEANAMYKRSPQGSRNYIDGPFLKSFEKGDFDIKMAPISQYTMANTVYRKGTMAQAIQQANRPMLQMMPSAQKTRRVNNVVYVDTSDQQGTYTTRALAIAAGEALGYPIVNATKLPNGFYMWNIPGKLLTVPCGEQFPDSGDIIKPFKWFMHGG